MQEFSGKVAVVTGAASGIGRAIAGRCLREGMKVVLADVEEAALSSVEQEFRAAGATVLAVRTDVSHAEDIEALARRTLDAFGEVHLLFNNAGVYGGSTIWESSMADWQWVMNVNLWGVIHGIRTFVPIMLAQESECHIVNTSSLAGLTAGYVSAPYQVTKHAVVALSENLHFSLASRTDRIKVSVLCPGTVNTNIVDSERNRPADLRNSIETDEERREREVRTEQARRFVASAMSSETVADSVFDGIRAGRLYIVPDTQYNMFIEERMANILKQANTPPRAE